MVTDIYAARSRKKRRAPLFLSSIAAGFPSPADDYIERSLDLNEQLIRHPSATFFVRVRGDSMTQAGIYSGDILIVDRSLTAYQNRIVVAVVNGEFTVKRFKCHGRKTFLIPENPKYQPMEIDRESDFEVWGVVIHVIHHV